MSKLRSTKKIDSIIIHCADTPNGACFCAEDIDDWHRDRPSPFLRSLLAAKKTNVSPHLKHIGYHYVIETTGDVIKGRALNETGAHVKGHNTRSIGICLIGKDAYTLKQWQALKVLLNSLKVRFKEAHILGHRMFDLKRTCPGFDVGEFLLNDKNPMDEHLI